MAEIEESGELDRLLVEPLQPRRDHDMYDKYFSRKENKTEARQYTRDFLMDKDFDARDRRIDETYARQITDSRDIELSPARKG